MVDHPFEPRPARVQAVRPFARPTEDPATSPRRGHAAGRPTPFVSPVVPEPTVTAPESEGEILVGPSPADGSPSSRLEDAEFSPQEFANGPPEGPSDEGSAGESAPYPSWETLMEEQGAPDPESSHESRWSGSAEHLPLEDVELEDEARPVDQTAGQIADAFWSGEPDQAGLEHAAASNLHEDSLRVIDLDERDVETAPSDVAVVAASRTDEADASSGAEEQPTQDLSAGESPSPDWRSERSEPLREVEPDDDDRHLSQGEMNAPMSVDDILLSDVSSYVVEHSTDAGESASEQRLSGDLEPLGDGSGVGGDYAGVTEADEIAQRAAERAELPDNRDDPATSTGPETETVVAAPAPSIRAGRAEVAAAVLERLAERLRRGELTLPESTRQADEALTLAQVLTALLGASGQGSHAELPPPATGTEL